MSASTSPTSSALGITTDTNDNSKRLENQLVVEVQKETTSIHLLPFELLSWIFELCSWKEWKSPLLIGCVCRKWRYIALNTPRAWSSIVIDQNEPLQNVYFERSGECGLHIHSKSGNLPVDIIGRIECMFLHVTEHGNLTRQCFSRLDRLSIANIFSFSAAYTMSILLFPMLRHLDLFDTAMLMNMDYSSVPALESLSLLIRDNSNTELAIIRGCTASLTSLTLCIVGPDSLGTPVDIDLPTLQYFNIKNPSASNMSWLSITAPALRVYIDDGILESKRCRMTNGLRTTTHLRLPELRSFRSLSNICAVQTLSSIPLYRRLLEEQRTCTESLPYLKDIQFIDGQWLESEEFGREVEEWNAQNTSPVTLTFVKEPRNEPP